MTIYYRGQELVITDRAVVLLTGPRVRFALAELRAIHIVRGDLDPSRVISAHSTGGALVVTAAAWPLIDSVIAAVAAGVVLVGSTVVSGACWRMHPRVWELRAIYRGMNVCLFSTADERTFGQVRRALVRALEHGHTHRPG
jgi:hypothetical protein